MSFHNFKAVRGGGCSEDPDWIVSVYHDLFSPSFTDLELGFRVVLR